MDYISCHHGASKKIRSEDSTIMHCCGMYHPQVNLLYWWCKIVFLIPFRNPPPQDNWWPGMVALAFKTMLPSLSSNALIRWSYGISKNHDRSTTVWNIKTIFDQVSPPWSLWRNSTLMLHFIKVWTTCGFWSLLCTPIIPTLVNCCSISYKSS